jgi:hypothetical protein
METSALNASNVEEAFTLLVKTIYQKKKGSSAAVLPPEPDSEDKNSEKIHIHSPPSPVRKKGCC